MNWLFDGWILMLVLGALYHMGISPVHWGYWACALICLGVQAVAPIMHFGGKSE